MTDSELLKSFVDQYQLQVNGVKFWTPYFINTPKVGNPNHAPSLPAPYLGKGTPAQIKEALLDAIARENANLTTPDEYRKFMHDQLIGIDCSGFIYRVLEALLVTKGIAIDDHLFWTRQELLEAYDKGTPWHQPELSRATVEAYPEQVALSRVASDWGWKMPTKLVTMKRLASDEISREISDVAGLRPADIIMALGREDDIPHYVVVVEATPTRVVYAHSGRTTGGIGGVEYGEMDITKPDQSLDLQEWQDSNFLKQRRFLGIRRWKILSDG